MVVLLAFGTITSLHAATYTNTNTSTTWTTGSAGWTNASGTPWDSVNGLTNSATFTNTSGFSTAISGNIFLNGINFSAIASANTINLGTLGSSTITFTGASSTFAMGTANATNIINASLVVTNTLSFTAGATGAINLRSTNFFTNGTISIAGGNGLKFLNVFGTNFGGTYNVNQSANLVVANGGNITNANAVNFLNGSGTLTVNATNQTGPVFTAQRINWFNGSTSGNFFVINSSYQNTTGAAFNITSSPNFTLMSGHSIFFNNASTNATNNTFGSSTITLMGGAFGYSAANSGANSVASLASVIFTNNIASSMVFTNSATSNNFLLGNITRDDDSMVQLTTVNGSTTGRVALINGGANLTFANGILPWAINTDSGGFVTTNTVAGTNYLVGTVQSTNANAKVTNLNTAADTDNYRSTNAGSTNLSTSRTIGSLLFGPSGSTTLSLGGNTLTVSSGGLALQQSQQLLITNGTLTAGNLSGAYNLFLWNPTSSGVMTIASRISDNNGNSVGLMKAGAGAIVLAASNSYTGRTVIQAGVLENANTGDLRNTTINVGATNVNSGAVFNNYGTASNIVLGASSTAYNLLNAGTILGRLTISAPINGLGTFWSANSAINLGNNGLASGSARLTNGSVVNDVLLNGRLDVYGTQGITVRGITNSGPLSTTAAGGIAVGSGVIGNYSTFTGANESGGTGIVFNFLAGAQLLSFIQATNSAATLTQSGSGTVNIGYFGYPAIAGITTNSTNTFAGGNWNVGQISQNTGNIHSGTINITNGANVIIQDGRYAAHGVWNIGQGTMTVRSRFTTEQASASNNRIQITVGAKGELNSAASDGIPISSGLASNGLGIPSFLVVNGGSVSLSNGALNIGVQGACTNANYYVTINSGTVAIRNGNTKMAQLLLDKGASMQAADKVFSAFQWI
jgi:autotransporter-associated beta strand protein